jgi:hypothetical protein
MVNANQKYNLNHIYYKYCAPGNLAVGYHVELDVIDIELFNKSLALTSDLKRLPILRSIMVNERYGRLTAAQMQASAVTNAILTLIVLNEKLNVAELETVWLNNLWEDHEVIYCAEMTIQQTAGQLTYHQLNESAWSFLGGILLGSNLTIGLITATATNVAAAQLPPVGAFDFFAEIDWQPVSKDEFEQFILENVYAKD